MEVKEVAQKLREAEQEILDIVLRVEKECSVRVDDILLYRVQPSNRLWATHMMAYIHQELKEE